MCVALFGVSGGIQPFIDKSYSPLRGVEASQTFTESANLWWQIPNTSVTFKSWFRGTMCLHQYNTKVLKKAQTLNLQENALGKKIAGKPGYPCKPVLSDHGITPLHWSASWTCWISICWVLKCLRSKITLLGQHWSVSVGVVWIGLSSLDYSNVLHTKKNMVHWKVLWRSQSCSAKTSVLKGIVQQKIWRAKFIAWSRKILLCSKKESKSYRF